MLIYDYEKEDGVYDEKSITFINVKKFNRIQQNDVTVDMISAYNAICEVIDSTLLDEEMLRKEFKHFLFYFDDYGAFEFIAENFIIN